jgi:hypothetical protein
VQFHRSAFKHGYDKVAILHAVEHALSFVDLDADSDPPKVLAIGAGPSGQLLEVIWLELGGGVDLVIHAMPLRRKFYDLLPAVEEDDHD